MFNKRASAYANEIDEMFMKHPEAVLNLYVEGMRAGRRNTVFFTTLGIVIGIVCSSAAVLTYLEHKERKNNLV